MPQLFTLPQQTPLSEGDVLPGAKLYFYQTNTTTLQNIYANFDLSVPHSNPVVADSEGTFGKIYLDASLPDYRVRLTDANDVLIWQIDDIPSGQDESRSYRITDTAPEIVLDQTGATANNRKWFIRAASGALTIGLLNDAESVRTDVIQITRTGSTANLVSFLSTAIAHDGQLIPSISSGTFTGTSTHFSPDLTATFRYEVVGNICTLYIPQALGTSDSTAFNFTGLPAAITPDRNQRFSFPWLKDNGADVFDGCSVTIATTGQIVFAIDGDNTGFTASGQKGVGSPGAVTYILT